MIRFADGSHYSIVITITVHLPGFPECQSRWIECSNAQTRSSTSRHHLQTACALGPNHPQTLSTLHGLRVQSTLIIEIFRSRTDTAPDGLLVVGTAIQNHKAHTHAPSGEVWLDKEAMEVVQGAYIRSMLTEEQKQLVQDESVKESLGSLSAECFVKLFCRGFCVGT